MSLRQRPVLLLQLGEQAHILDGNDRLVGESLEEGNLLVGERSHVQSPDHDPTDWRALAEQGGREHGTIAKIVLDRLTDGELGFDLSRHVLDVDSSPVGNGSANRGTPIKRHLLYSRERPILRYQPEDVTLQEANDRVVRSADARGILSYYIEYRLEVGWRAGDHPQDLSCGRLLFLRLRLVPAECG